MAATADQKLKTRVFLGITKEDAAKTIAAGDAADGLFVQLDALDSAELAQLDVYLARVAEFGVGTDVKIKTDGVDIDPSRDRALLTADICTLVGIGINPGFYPIGTADDDDDDDCD